jgi:hypothetical protein
MDERNPTMDIVDGISQSVHDSQPDGGQSRLDRSFREFKTL